MDKKQTIWAVSLDQPKDMSTDYIEKSWNRDKLLLHAVQTGNNELLKQEIVDLKNDQAPQHYYGNPIIAGDILRTRKNGMIIRNTICRVAAGMGGVPPLYLHLISEKYVLQIEQASSAAFLVEQLTYDMFQEYCDLVANFSSAKYSPAIKDIVVYITSHINEPVTLSELAEVFHINAAHLSRKFKKETGFTVSQYVNHQKVDAAKLLFARGSTSVMEVADQLGFNSSSYFSKLFKKITGEAPADYLERLSQ